MDARMRSDIGRYNLLGNEKSLQFSVILMEGAEIVKEDGHYAKLHISKSEGEEDLVQLQQELEEYFEKGYFDNILDKAYEYASRVISSTDYKQQCLTFIKVYARKAEEINHNLLSKKKKDLQDKIDRLQKQLDEYKEIPNVLSEMQGIVLKDASKYLKWAEMEKKELQDLRIESDKYKEKEIKFNNYIKKADDIKKFVEMVGAL